MKNHLGITDDFQTQPVIAQRHMEELRTTQNVLSEVLQLLKSDLADIVIAANYLREGSEALGRITGRIYSDDILDNIFGKFCVGK
jgi:tRNA modification GTPase